MKRAGRTRAPLVAVVGGFLALAVLSGCGGGGHGSATPGSETITLYNGQHPQTTQALIAAFEHETGIRVRERDGSEDQLVQEIEQEGSSSPADVIFTENSPALMTLQGKNLLTTLPPTLLSEVPAQYSSPTGAWMGVSARVSVLVYNTSRLQPTQLPTSIFDLADPRWKGKLALAPTETDFQPIVTSIAKARGDQAAVAWLNAVKSNASAHIEPDNETVTADVNSGQASLGLIDHYYWYRLAKEVGQSGVHSNIAYFAPGDPGYVIDVSGAGVLRSSKHQVAAEQFLQFLDSPTGQQTIVGSDSFEYPLRPGVAAAAVVKPFNELQPNPISVADLGDGSAAVRLEQEAQLI